MSGNSVSDQNITDPITNKLSSIIDGIAEKASLLDRTADWNRTIQDSFALKPLFAIFETIKRLVPASFERVGTLMQDGAYLLSVLLFALVGLPQFASDKFGLAFVIIAGLALWLLGRVLSGKQTRSFDSFDAIVLAYLAANVVAAFASHYFVPSLKGLSKVIIYIGSYFLFTAVFAGNLKRKLIVVTMAILCGVALSLYGLYQYKIGVAPLATWEDPSVEGGGGTRIFATMNNPNLLAGFFVPLAPLAVAVGLGCLGQAKSVSKPIIAYALAVIFCGSGMLIALATVLTGSRGGYLGLIAGFGLILYIGIEFLWATYKKFRKLLVIGAISLAICGVLGAGLAIKYVPSVNQRFASIFAGSEHSSNAYRINVYRSSFKMFCDNWWIGTGPGNETFRLAYGLYMVSSYDALGTYCVPLEVAVETGVLGLVAFVLLIVCAMSRAHMKFWNPRAPAVSRWLAAGLAAATAGLMIHGAVDTVFYRPQVHFLFWLIVSLIVTGDIAENRDPIYNSGDRS